MEERIAVARSWTVLERLVNYVFDKKAEGDVLQDGVDLANECHADVESGFGDVAAELGTVSFVPDSSSSH